MDFLRIFGYARVSFFTHACSIDLPKKPKTSSSSEPTSLLSFCKSITPPCTLNPLLFNGHLQTFWTVVNSSDIPIFHRRHIFKAEDPTFAGTFAVDFVVPPYNGTDESLPPRTMYYTDKEFEEIGSDDGKPMLVTLHGLSGGSHEIYLRSVLQPLIEAGWEACVVNSRGCAKSRITSGVLYNARATWDVRQIVKWLRRKFPHRPLFGIGFSLGANILVNVRVVDRNNSNCSDSDLVLCFWQYLGEEGEMCELKAAVVCSNPWNLEISSVVLQRTWLGKDIYQKTMGDSMKNLVEE